MARSSKSYFDYSSLLYYITYGYEFILIGKVHLIKDPTMSNLHDKMKKLMEDYKVWTLFCVPALKMRMGEYHYLYHYFDKVW
jgi:hypothetical protein